jgi:putative endonuclease
VTERQKHRIAAAAEAWLASYPQPTIRDMRFDAILVAPGRLPRHIPAAFEIN